jgi:signal transduction histidine kinase
MQRFNRASLALLGLAAVFWSFFLAFVGLHLAAPSDGARVLGWAESGGVRVAPLVADGLQENDVVIAIDGRSVESLARALADFGQPAPQWAFGQTVVYTIQRDGEHLEVPIQLRTYPLGAALAREWGAVVAAIVLQLTMGFVFFKRPNEPIVRAMFLSSAAMVSSTTWSIGLTLADIAGRAGFWLSIVSSNGVYILLWVGALHAILLFPTPWPPLARWRWIVPALYAAPYLAFAVVTLFVPTPHPLLWQAKVGRTIGYLQAGYGLAAIAAAVRSFRAARDPVSRAQVRWVVTGFVLTFSCAFAFGILPELILGYPLLSWSLLALTGLFFPIAFAVGILRYRLFDIDIILNRALVYGILTTVVVALYVAVVGGLSALLETRASFIVSLLITALAAVIFQPLRERLQRAVNRLMYGERDEPYLVLTHLGQRLETTLAPDSILSTIVEAVAQTLKLPYAAITFGDADSQHIAAAYGLPPSPLRPSPDGRGVGGEGLILPLRYQHDLIGHLFVAQRSPAEPFTPAEQHLLNNIARQIGVAAHNVRLTADLQQSRERLVTTREEERRRIRRDLHDGLGPALASHSYQLDALLDLIDQNPDAAKNLIANLKAQTRSTLADIRRLVYELRPPALDELGLVAALQAQWAAQDGLHVSIESPPGGLPPLSAAVEVAAYRIAMEAVTNAARHANAQNCRVRFAAKESELTVEIADDGSGIQNGARAGVGLASMKERAAELGGECMIDLAETGGTRVVAQMPITNSQ